MKCEKTPTYAIFGVFNCVRHCVSKIHVVALRNYGIDAIVRKPAVKREQQGTTRAYVHVLHAVILKLRKLRNCVRVTSEKWLTQWLTQLFLKKIASGLDAVR